MTGELVETVETQEAWALRTGRAVSLDPIERIARGIQKAREPEVAYEDSEWWEYRKEAQAMVAANVARRARWIGAQRD